MNSYETITNVVEKRKIEGKLLLKMKIMEECGDNISMVEVEIVQKKKSNVDKRLFENEVEEWLRRKEHVPNGIIHTYLKR